MASPWVGVDGESEVRTVASLHRLTRRRREQSDRLVSFSGENGLRNGLAVSNRGRAEARPSPRRAHGEGALPRDLVCGGISGMRLARRARPTTASGENGLRKGVAVSNRGRAEARPSPRRAHGEGALPRDLVCGGISGMRLARRARPTTAAGRIRLRRKFAGHEFARCCRGADAPPSKQLRVSYARLRQNSAPRPKRDSRTRQAKKQMP